MVICSSCSCRSPPGHGPTNRRACHRPRPARTPPPPLQAPGLRRSGRFSTASRIQVRQPRRRDAIRSTTTGPTCEHGRACPRSARDRGTPAASAPRQPRLGRRAGIHHMLDDSAAAPGPAPSPAARSHQTTRRRPAAHSSPTSPVSSPTSAASCISVRRRLPSRIPFHQRLPFRLVLDQTPGTYGTEASSPPSSTTTRPSLEKSHTLPEIPDP